MDKVRLIDIARYLRVSKSTASLMIKKLIRRDLLRKSNEGLLLTSKGIKIYREIAWRHGITELALMKLGLPPEDACRVAKCIEFRIPYEQLKRIWAKLGYPTICTHNKEFVAKAGKSPVTCRPVD